MINFAVIIDYCWLLYIYLLIVNTTTTTDSILHVHFHKHWKQLNLKFRGVCGASWKLQLRVHTTLKSGAGFTRNLPLKSGDDQYIKISRNKILDKLKTNKIRHFD